MLRLRFTKLLNVDKFNYLCRNQAASRMRLKTYARQEDRSWWKPFDLDVAAITRDDPIKLQMAHFAAVVRGEAAPLVTARDGWMNLRVTEAIVQAAASGQTIFLDSPDF